MCKSKVNKVILSFKIFRGKRLITCIQKCPLSSYFGLAYTSCFSVDSGLRSLLFVGPDNLYLHICISHSQCDCTYNKHSTSELSRLQTLFFGYFKLIFSFLLIHRLHLCIEDRLITGYRFMWSDRTFLLIRKVKYITSKPIRLSRDECMCLVVFGELWYKSGNF
jgi:hypothetical protein